MLTICDETKSKMVTIKRQKMLVFNCYLVDRIDKLYKDKGKGKLIKQRS